MSIGGVWSVTTFPTEDVMKAADIFYLGGRTYEIKKGIYDSLVAQGYGAYVKAE
jgi:hypothetical protein